MLEPPPVAEMTAQPQATALLLVLHVAIRTAATQMAGMLVVAVWAACAAAEQVHASSAVQVAAMRVEASSIAPSLQEGRRPSRRLAAVPGR